MQQGISDTDPEAARIQLELLRTASPQRRLRLALSLSRTVMSLTKGRLSKSFPNASSQEVGLHFVTVLYGSELADQVRADLAARRR